MPLWAGPRFDSREHQNKEPAGPGGGRHEASGADGDPGHRSTGTSLPEAGMGDIAPPSLGPHHGGILLEPLGQAVATWHSGSDSKYSLLERKLNLRLFPFLCSIIKRSLKMGF